MIFSFCRSLRRAVGVCLGGLCALTLTGTVRAEASWAASAVDVEVGFLRSVRHNTPINYTLVPTQLSWRSSPFLNREWANGSRLVVRHRLTLIGTWVQKGPESHYLGVSGSPSIEWWNKAGTLAAFGGAGGGFGVIDSRGVPGGQGQDFTLNWFMRAGVEHVVNARTRVLAGVMFQHLSNGGMTKPNPGIDALGVTFGGSWSF
jgi:lipid A 3-O-deacylase